MNARPPYRRPIPTASNEHFRRESRGVDKLRNSITVDPANVRSSTVRTTNRLSEHRKTVWVPSDKVNRQFWTFPIWATVSCASTALYEGQVARQFRLHQQLVNSCHCLLYTSDAADEED